jgi:hypothetical protein
MFLFLHIDYPWDLTTISRLITTMILGGCMITWLIGKAIKRKAAM